MDYKGYVGQEIIRNDGTIGKVTGLGKDKEINIA